MLMAANSFRPGPRPTPAFVEPFLHALNRMQQRETLRPEQLTARAQALLADTMGTKPHPVEAAFAHGNLGLMAEHTHYFDGFALMMRLAQGTAVAVRMVEGSVSRIAEEGRGARTFDGTDDPPAEQDQVGCLVGALIEALAPPGMGVEAAVVSTVPFSCEEARLASAGGAAARALQALFARSDDTKALLTLVQNTIVQSIGRPLSMAYLPTNEAPGSSPYTIVDTATFERMPVEVSSRESPGWGLVETGVRSPGNFAFYRRKQEQVSAALAALQRKGFSGLNSFRALEHQDLQRALSVSPRRFRPVINYVVTENQRVQKLVTAVRRSDWQMLGALLKMSHAALKSDWESTSAETDFVVEQVEEMSIDGMYGAGQRGRGGVVLAVGQPYTVPPSLDRIKSAYEARFGTPPAVRLL